MKQTANLEKISKIVTKETIGFYLLSKTAIKQLDADFEDRAKKYVIFYAYQGGFNFDTTDDINGSWDTIFYADTIEEMITEADAAFLLRYGRKVRDFL